MSDRGRGLTLAAAMFACGLIGAGIAAAALGVSSHDATVLVSIAAGGAVFAGGVGWILVRALRSHSIRVQVTVVAVVAVVATGLGSWLAAKAMFISSHDLGAFLVILIASAAGGAGAATACATTVSEASESLGQLARNLAPGRPGNGEARAGFDRDSNDDGPSIAAQPAGDFARVAAELVDVSRRLDAARSQADALDASRRELVAWVSHDLRAPLATIRAMAEALEDGVSADDHTVDRYHVAIRVEAERLTKLVDELFQLSRLTSGVQVPDPDRAELGELVDFEVAAGAPLGEQRRVRVEADVAPDGTAHAAVPARDVARILANLIDNAVRHSRSGSVVRVCATSGPNEVQVRVDDECGGIRPADLERVFDTAFRSDTARNRDHAGGGLGLPIARGLAELVGGTLDVENVGNGCRFLLAVPLDTTATATVGGRRSGPVDVEVTSDGDGVETAIDA